MFNSKTIAMFFSSSWNTAKRRQNQLTTKEKDSKQIPLLEAQPKPQRALRHKAVEV